MYSHSQGVIRHKIKKTCDGKDNKKKINNGEKNKNEKFSPKTLQKDSLNDNFIKFQWPWIL